MAVLAQEVTSVTCVAKAAIDASEYFLLYGMGSDFEENAYHVWFDKAGGDSEPSGLSSTGIECDISSVSTATDVGGVVATQVAANADFSASNDSGILGPAIPPSIGAGSELFFAVFVI